MTQTMTRLTVHAIDPVRLAAMRTAGVDEHGNPFTAFPAEGGDPLRCCLTRAEAGEQIALISYAPFQRVSPWTEVGPVYVHADACTGYPAADELPALLRFGPRVLRTYHADGSLDYDHIRVLTGEHDDCAPVLAELLTIDAVDQVHVRTLAPQCFLYAVTR
jgi:hypothetical protein